MSTAEDIWDDVHINAIHDAHVAAGENHWFSCPLCDDEAEEEGDDTETAIITLHQLTEAQHMISHQYAHLWAPTPECGCRDKAVVMWAFLHGDI